MKIFIVLLFTYVFFDISLAVLDYNQAYIGGPPAGTQGNGYGFDGGKGVGRYSRRNGGQGDNNQAPGNSGMGTGMGTGMGPGYEGGMGPGYGGAMGPGMGGVGGMGTGMAIADGISALGPMGEMPRPAPGGGFSLFGHIGSLLGGLLGRPGGNFQQPLHQESYEHPGGVLHREAHFTGHPGSHPAGHPAGHSKEHHGSHPEGHSAGHSKEHSGSHHEGHPAGHSKEHPASHHKDHSAGHSEEHPHPHPHEHRA